MKDIEMNEHTLKEIDMSEFMEKVRALKEQAWKDWNRQKNEELRHQLPRNAR